MSGLPSSEFEAMSHLPHEVLSTATVDTPIARFETAPIPESTSGKFDTSELPPTTSQQNSLPTTNVTVVDETVSPASTILSEAVSVGIDYFSSASLSSNSTSTSVGLPKSPDLKVPITEAEQPKHDVNLGSRNGAFGFPSIGGEMTETETHLPDLPTTITTKNKEKGTAGQENGNSSRAESIKKNDIAISLLEPEGILCASRPVENTGSSGRAPKPEVLQPGTTADSSLTLTADADKLEVVLSPALDLKFLNESNDMIPILQPTTPLRLMDLAFKSFKMIRQPNPNFHNPRSENTTPEINTVVNVPSPRKGWEDAPEYVAELKRCTRAEKKGEDPTMSFQYHKHPYWKQGRVYAVWWETMDGDDYALEEMAGQFWAARENAVEDDRSAEEASAQEVKRKRNGATSLSNNKAGLKKVAAAKQSKSVPMNRESSGSSTEAVQLGQSSTDTTPEIGHSTMRNECEKPMNMIGDSATYPEVENFNVETPVQGGQDTPYLILEQSQYVAPKSNLKYNPAAEFRPAQEKIEMGQQPVGCDLAEEPLNLIQWAPQLEVEECTLGSEEHATVPWSEGGNMSFLIHDDELLIPNYQQPYPQREEMMETTKGKEITRLLNNEETTIENPNTGFAADLYDRVSTEKQPATKEVFLQLRSSQGYIHTVPFSDLQRECHPFLSYSTTSKPHK